MSDSKINADALMDRPCDDVLNRAIMDYAKRVAAETESLVARYMVETKLNASDICLVERQTETGRVIYPDLKSKYDVDNFGG